MRSLIRAVYRFRDAALVAEKKDDFGNALQNLYRELERAEDLVGPERPTPSRLLPLSSPIRSIAIGHSVTVSSPLLVSEFRILRFFFHARIHHFPGLRESEPDTLVGYEIKSHWFSFACDRLVRPKRLGLALWVYHL